MTKEAQFEQLLNEVELFVAEEEFALTQENWPYLQELMQKKDGHLRAMEALGVNTLPYRERLKSVLTRHSATAQGVQARMDSVRRELDQAAQVRVRMAQVRQMAPVEPVAGGWQAQA